MPYINAESRSSLDPIVDKLDPSGWTTGEFAYVTYKLLKRFIKLETGGYARAASGVGVLVLTAMHYAMTDLFEYENIKKQQNGDVE